MTIVPGPVPAVPSQDPKWTSIFDEGGTERLALLVDLFTEFGGGGGGGTFPDFTGSGSPEGSVVADVGQTYVDTDGSALWYKSDDSGFSTGWINLSADGSSLEGALIDLGGVTGIISQGGGTTVIASSSFVDILAMPFGDEDFMAVLNGRIFLDFGTAGEQGQPIVIDLRALLAEIPFLSVGYDPGAAVKAHWQGPIAGVMAVGMLWNPADSAAHTVQVADTGGVPITDALAVGDAIFFSASWFIASDPI